MNEANKEKRLSMREKISYGFGGADACCQDF